MFIEVMQIKYRNDLLALNLKPVWGCMIPGRNLFFIVLIPNDLEGHELFDAMVLGGPIDNMKLYKVKEGHIYSNGEGFVEIDENPFRDYSLGFKKGDDGKWKAYHDGMELIAFEIQTTQ